MASDVDTPTKHAPKQEFIVLAQMTEKQHKYLASSLFAGASATRH